MVIKLKRAYEVPESGDGFRVLVDRLWPRGVSKDSARIDLWFKEIAPSTALRKWFGHAPERWQEFCRRYRAELKHNPVATHLRKFAQRRVVTLVYAAHDQNHNHALVLAAFLRPSTIQRSAVKRVRTSKKQGKP